MKIRSFLIPALFILLTGICGLQGASPQSPSEFPMQHGQFTDSWDSLRTYQCPEWFRDAKFGIWAIIGPQCIPMQGDWYARNMYIQGHRQYEYHVKHYGHPSQFGYKDLIEKFNPHLLDYDQLTALYKEAGAKYAVILAVHHDNFDLWNSKYQPWNSVNKGPHRDLVGEFRTAALKQGLRFGVTTHLARSYSWLQTSHGADKTGPMAHVPYDGANPLYQKLYHPPFKESAHYPTLPPISWQEEWYLRVKDLIDQYHPDLMYFDGGFPFDDGAAGRRVTAHYYNINSLWHSNRNDAVMCVKKRPDDAEHGIYRDGTCVQDIERGHAGHILELPWQTDTCIGQWYYREGIQYKTPQHIIHLLIDIVSKNGNLLLNLPIHPEGYLDEREIDFLKEMGKWMAINGKGLYETRPWLVYGEGPTNSGGGHFNEDASVYTSKDFRFTAKGDHGIYAFFMQWPEDNHLLIQSLAKQQSSKAQITQVNLLGAGTPLTYSQTDQGLAIELPQEQPCQHAWAIVIKGKNLRDFSLSTEKPDTK